MKTLALATLLVLFGSFVEGNECRAEDPIPGTSYYGPQSGDEIVVAAYQAVTPTTYTARVQWSLGSVASPCPEGVRRSCQLVRQRERTLRVRANGALIVEAVSTNPDEAVVLKQTLTASAPAFSCVEISIHHLTDYLQYDAAGSVVSIVPIAVAVLRESLETGVARSLFLRSRPSWGVAARARPRE